MVLTINRWERKLDMVLTINWHVGLEVTKVTLNRSGCYLYVSRRGGPNEWLLLTRRGDIIATHTARVVAAHQDETDVVDESILDASLDEELAEDGPDALQRGARRLH